MKQFYKNLKTIFSLLVAIMFLVTIKAQNGGFIADQQISQKTFSTSTASSAVTWTKLTTANGLPSNVIKDVIFDKTGHLWIATNAGVSKYNGTTFQNYTVANGLHTNTIGRLYCDNLNRIWAIGDYNGPGLSVFTDAWQPFAKNSSVPKPAFVFQDASNTIYITEGAGNIYKYDGTNVQLYLQTPSQRISNAIFDKNGVLWVMASLELLKYNGTTLAETKTLNSNGVGSTYIIEKDKLGKLWIIMGNSLYKSDDLSTFNLLGTTTANYYWDIAFDSQNNLYLSRYSKGGGGIKTYIGNSWGSFDGSNGLTYDTANGVVIDNKDIVWVGAEDGLYFSTSVITALKDETTNSAINNIELFPNPTANFFSINGLTGVANISIIDLSGKVFISKQITANQKIDVGSLTHGVYFVKITTANGQVIRKLVTK